MPRLAQIVLAFVIAAVALTPAVTQAATSSGSLSGVTWQTEIQLNTRTSSFGKYVFAYGRTKATGDILSQLRASLKIK